MYYVDAQGRAKKVLAVFDRAVINHDYVSGTTLFVHDAIVSGNKLVILTTIVDNNKLVLR